MKRSEVVLMIAEALGQLPAPAYTVAEEVLSRLEGPLSIDYEPEEEPLPERLEVGVTAAGLSFLKPYGAEFQGEAHKRATLREVAHLWNARKELRELADCLGDDGYKEDRVRRMKLLAILGKEGE